MVPHIPCSTAQHGITAHMEIQKLVGLGLLLSGAALFGQPPVGAAAAQRRRPRRPGLHPGPLHQVRIPHPHARWRAPVRRGLRSQGCHRSVSHPHAADALQRRPLWRRQLQVAGGPDRWPPKKRASSSSTRTCAAATCRRACSWTCARTRPITTAPPTPTRAPTPTTPSTGW